MFVTIIVQPEIKYEQSLVQLTYGLLMNITNSTIDCQGYLWELEFYRTHTLCALDTVSTDCTCTTVVIL